MHRSEALHPNTEGHGVSRPSTMTSEHATRPDDVAEHVADVEASGSIVLYDQRANRAWIQSDVAVELDQMR